MLTHSFRYALGIFDIKQKRELIIHFVCLRRNKFTKHKMYIYGLIHLTEVFLSASSLFLCRQRCHMFIQVRGSARWNPTERKQTLFFSLYAFPSSVGPYTLHTVQVLVCIYMTVHGLCSRQIRLPAYLSSRTEVDAFRVRPEKVKVNFVEEFNYG